MFDTISCEADHLTEMYQNRYIHNTIMNSDACVEYGLDFLTIKKKSKKNQLVLLKNLNDFKHNNICAVFVAQMCILLFFETIFAVFDSSRINLSPKSDCFA